VDGSLYYAALEHRDRMDPEVVMPSVSRKTGKAKRRLDEAPAKAGKS
jgi:hypothetical protein